jgi:hypothetical protein
VRTKSAQIETSTNSQTFQSDEGTKCIVTAFHRNALQVRVRNKSIATKTKDTVVLQAQR